MSDPIEKINKNLQAVSLDVVTLESGDVSALGNILNCFCDLEESIRELDQPAFLDLTHALKSYLERMILAGTDDVGPLEEGINGLQTICRSLSNQEAFGEDISPLLQKLDFEKPAPKKGAKKGTRIKGKKGAATSKGEEEVKTPAPAFCEEDRQILYDFVLEALENLDTIEVRLVDLEQDPTDLETINAIFRPFHTIKGVSGFLNLGKINKLAHSAENILDKARNGEIRIETPVIDITLESVDLLKRMIQGVQEGLESGAEPHDAIDIAPLVHRLEELNLQEDQMGEKPLGEILIQKREITPEDLEKGLTKQKEEPDKKIGEILIEEKKADSKAVISALRDQKRFTHRQIDLQVKVDTEKLDSLMDLTGELVIAQSMLRQNQWILSTKDQSLYHNLNQLNQITSGLQRTAMSMRMIPIRNTFQKMVRLVRDLANHSKKEVELEMSGEDTEIDRNMVEELYEPMVHMIRNAVDHGIETPDEREKTGKKRKGTIHLRAYHRAGCIIIEIDDDGRGLDKERIIEKANTKNLITHESKLTDSEIYNLIFQPGFSTAKTVTDISGRGVGMDVVKKAIEKLRGRVEINSRPGQGSTFMISMPLTLAIVEGMVVRVGKERYVIPTLAIFESFRPNRDQYATVEGKGEMILSRGNLIPLIRLDGILGGKGDVIDPWEGLVVAVEHDATKMCLLLDELLGKEEVVIKSLGESLKYVKGIAGGAIMGDGRVGLILDMSGIFEIANGI